MLIHVKLAYAKNDRNIDENDMTYFVTYNLRAIREAINDFDAYIQRKLQEQKKLVLFMRDQHELNFRQAELIDKGITDPNISYTVKVVQNTFNVVHQTARTDLKGLIDKGLFVEKKIGRVYYFSPVVNIKEKLDQLK